MALKKEITLDSGVVGEYLRIESFTYKSNGKMCNLNLGFYKDKACRDAGMPYIHVVPIEFVDAVDVSVAGIYTYLKTLDAYSGAEDI